MKKIEKQLSSYLPKNDDEAQSKKLMLKDLKIYGNELLYRTCEKAHFTSSSIILNKDMDYVLMAHHNIYQTWAWIGGHNDGESDFLKVALQEAKEETGLKDILVIDSNIISIEILKVKKHIKNNKFVPEHLHYNISFVFIASMDDEIRPKIDENSAVSWIKIDDLHQYTNEPHMYHIYLNIINRAKLFKKSIRTK